MKKINLVISEKPLKATKDDICWYSFDESSLDTITAALDKIQEIEAHLHYKKEQSGICPAGLCNGGFGCTHAE